MKTDETIQGLVVEEHADRIVLSTVDGEQMIMRREIISIQYDDLEYSLVSLGRLMEEKKKYPAALSYYERAYQENPGFVEARQAALGIRSKMWAEMTEGPVAEIEKQEALQGSWLGGKLAEEREADHEHLLYDRLGLRLEADGDFTRVASVRIGSAAHEYGIRKDDVLFRSDGKSLRYLNKAAVILEVLYPRFSNMTLEVQRTLAVPSPHRKTGYARLGFRMEQDLHGLVVKEVSAGSVAQHMGLKAGDVITAVNGQPARYTPQKDVTRLIDNAAGKPLVLVINRFLDLTRS